MTITDFITHRLAEAEGAAADGNEAMDPVWLRLIRLLVLVFHEHGDVGYGQEFCVCGESWPCRPMRLLADLWRDHEDFHPGWRMS